MKKKLSVKSRKVEVQGSAQGLSKHHVTIKGVKDGLVFVLNDACTYTDLIAELQHKLSKTHNKILTGPTVSVQIKLGKRIINEAERAQILSLIGSRNNLVVKSIESEPSTSEPDRDCAKQLKIIKGIVRSGQTIEHTGNLLLFGDVNPGGSILATGDIYIMGSLRGLAHAGTEGQEEAIIAASHLRPTQLRISNIISRPPDEWGIEKESFMEFAYIRDGAMVIDKINQLYRVRPDAPTMLI